MRNIRIIGLSFAVTILTMLLPVIGLQAADEQVIQKESANGTRNLRPFTVKDHWEVRWENKGSMLTITAYREDAPADDPLAKMPVVVGMATQAGSGASYQPKGGRYYLAVGGTGAWTVTVVQLP